MNKKEVKAIQDAIESKGLNWSFQENFLTELPKKERSSYLGYTPGPNQPTLKEQEELAKTNYANYLSSSERAESFGIPSDFDWRNRGGKSYVTAVKNQGSCGSCVAFGTLAAVESKVKIQRGYDTDVNLSEAHLFYCIARSQGRRCNNGWWPEPAMIACRDTGVTDETCYPYVAGDQNCSNLCGSWASSVTKITGYQVLDSINTIKDWIATEGPVQACFTVYNDFFGYNGGVYRQTSNDVAGGHCVCLIGYDDSLKCWIARNSWGTGWGNSGFFKIGYGECGIDSDCYGVNAIEETRWIKGKKVIGLWANKSEKNAYVYLSGGVGWLKIANTNHGGYINSLVQLASAKADNSNLNIRLYKGEIVKQYVF